MIRNLTLDQLAMFAILAAIVAASAVAILDEWVGRRVGADVAAGLNRGEGR